MPPFPLTTPASQSSHSRPHPSIEIVPGSLYRLERSLASRHELGDGSRAPGLRVEGLDRLPQVVGGSSTRTSAPRPPLHPLPRYSSLRGRSPALCNPSPCVSLPPPCGRRVG
ncbi:hypothetical protein L202_03216 [Cryptococcus amylolentus CBS 6039]|uniref:Uncharacterized protein n=1 Tax=Cryptococcus amylolentus CBS 6039 TaxID=1295533 RepID=A0A1E3HY93_9TREE|nr:hypothetical protein L202_03216 [Cryptococcus amylolentus CBS 6039]ODN81125.1 hypothetical protein L202_03216 [Cryptococcus amylolentus CBS 6039]